MSKVICKGSFGPIISARDDVEEKKVAIKSFSDCWENVNDLIEILKDIMAMKLLGDHQNVSPTVICAYLCSSSQFKHLIR